MLGRMKRMRRGPGTLTFVRTELETGFTFATIAAQARDEEKIDRNRANARKACWSARHFMERMPLSASESDELHQKLEELEGRLRRLQKVV